MAKLPQKNAFASETVDSFGGIDRTDNVGLLSEAFDMANIRILDDGSLTRREGTFPLASMPSPVRATAVCPTDPNYLFVLSGEVLYSVNLSTGEKLELSQGFNLYAPAFFFRMSKDLYIFCEGLYLLKTEEISGMDGYIPLVGHNWGVDGGEIYEPQNLLAFQVRIDYLLDRETNSVYTGFDLSAVDAMYVNGEAVTGATIDRQYVQLPAIFPAGTRILLCLSLSLSEIHNVLSFLSCTGACSCGHDDNAVAVLYGGEEPTRLFFLRYATEEQVAESRIYYPDSSYFYCPVDPTHIVEMAGGVRAVCGEPDCLLVIGEHETRRLTPDGEAPIPGVGGCESSAAVAYFDGNAYICSAEGIRHLPLRSGNGEIISAPLGNLLTSNIAKSAILYYSTFWNELLVRDVTDSTGTVLVYSPKRRTWCKFIGIKAEGFFEYMPKRSVGFWSQLELIYLTDGQSYDILPGGTRTPIPIYFYSRWSALGRPDAVKRIRRLRLALSGGGDVQVMLSDGTGYFCDHTFSAGSRKDMSFFDRSVNTGRTVYMQMILVSTSEKPTRIHGVTLSAIK